MKSVRSFLSNVGHIYNMISTDIHTFPAKISATFFKVLYFRQVTQISNKTPFNSYIP